MHILRLLAIVALSAILSGCYNPHRFQSDAADILVQWTNPKYRIVFEPVEVGGDIKSTYTFRHPPSIPLYMHLVFLDRADLNLLAQHDTTVIVVLRNGIGDIIYDEQSRIEPQQPWEARSFYAIRPPEQWCAQAKGKVVRRIFEWNELDEGQAEHEWTRFPPSGTAIALPGELRLRSHERYTLTIEVETCKNVEKRIEFYPNIQGGYFSL